MRRFLLPILTAVVLAASVTPALAQYSDDGIAWGVQGSIGTNYPTVPPESGAVRTFEPNYTVGLFASMPFIGSFRFQPEVKWDHRDVTIGGVTTKMDYLSVPLLLRSSFLGIYMSQGVAINVPMRVSIFDVDFKSAYTSPDVAIILGVGKRVGRVSIEGRWDTGFRSMQKGLEAGGTRHRALTAVVSYQINSPE